MNIKIYSLCIILGMSGLSAYADTITVKNYAGAAAILQLRYYYSAPGASWTCKYEEKYAVIAGTDDMHKPKTVTFKMHYNLKDASCEFWHGNPELAVWSPTKKNTGKFTEITWGDTKVIPPTPTLTTRITLKNETSKEVMLSANVLTANPPIFKFVKPGRTVTVPDAGNMARASHSRIPFTLHPMSGVLHNCIVVGLRRLSINSLHLQHADSIAFNVVINSKGRCAMTEQYY